MVLFIHRPEYYHIYKSENGEDLRGKAIIIIAKHRNGSVGDVLLTFKGQYARFENPEDSMRIPLPGENAPAPAAPPVSDAPVPPPAPFSDEPFNPMESNITPF